MDFRICCFSDHMDYKIRADGREYLFDFSERFGPSVQRKDGRGEVKNQPNPKAEFWKAVTLWFRQGKHLDSDGYCMWQYPPKEIAYRISKRTLISEEMYMKLRSNGDFTELEKVEIRHWLLVGSRVCGDDRAQDWAKAPRSES